MLPTSETPTVMGRLYRLSIGALLLCSVAAAFHPLCNVAGRNGIRVGRGDSPVFLLRRVTDERNVQRSASIELQAARKRKRKRKPVLPTSEEPSVADFAPGGDPAPDEESEARPVDSKPTTFSFDRDEAMAIGIEDAESEDDIPPEFSSMRKELGGGRPLAPLGDLRGAMDLPDIKELAKRKREADRAKVQEEKESIREKIQRSDIRSFTKLLEVEPAADSDSSFFVDEEYGSVSALLGEGVTFLGIPLAILQVGHFIGGLGICLCAFIDYPGFPLTSLPLPVRSALQGGLAAVLVINILLSVASVFEANKRDQPVGLWVAKTLVVGGLSFDQLVMLPTKKTR